MEYPPINRFTMETKTKRQLDVSDQQLADNKCMVGDESTIADMSIWPWWYGVIILGKLYDGCAEFLDIWWAEEFVERPAVKRGCMVNRNWGTVVAERHDASDFGTKTNDKLDAAKAEAEEESGVKKVRD
jgi:GST-like protein